MNEQPSDLNEQPSDFEALRQDSARRALESHRTGAGGVFEVLIWMGIGGAIVSTVLGLS